jgi:hypothetical protein
MKMERKAGRKKKEKSANKTPIKIEYKHDEDTNG